MLNEKNMELSDDAMEQVTGGNSEERYRTTTGVVTGTWGIGENNYVVMTETNGEIVANYGAIGCLMENGTRVKVALVGMGKWQIIEVLDVC